MVAIAVAMFPEVAGEDPYVRSEVDVSSLGRFVNLTQTAIHHESRRTAVEATYGAVDDPGVLEASGWI